MKLTKLPCAMVETTARNLAHGHLARTGIEWKNMSAADRNAFRVLAKTMLKAAGVDDIFFALKSIVDAVDCEEGHALFDAIESYGEPAVAKAMGTTPKAAA